MLIAMNIAMTFISLIIILTVDAAVLIISQVAILETV